MAKNHDNRVYIVPCDTGDRYVIAHTAAQAREHVVKDFVGIPRKASAIEVANASASGTRIETVQVQSDE